MRLLNAFDDLFSNCRPHFKQERTFQRARALAYASLLTYGRHTITRLICSKNAQHQDWSADYRLFSMRQWSADDLFFEILTECDRHSHWPQNAVVVALDDTARKKTGKKIPGVCTLRDPMSLPYHVNLIPGIRFLQGSMIINPDKRIEYNRAIPILFHKAAPAKKPKKNASSEAKELYKEEKKKKRISVQGRKAAIKIRQQIDQLPDGTERDLFLTVDGSFCNKYFLRWLPDKVIPIARARKDLKLFNPADQTMRANRVYGEQLPTPDEIRKDDAYPWIEMRVFFAGAYHDIRYKTVAPVLWQTGTLRQRCRLIIIAPLGYRLKKGSRKLYRDPAYLIIPDMETAVERLLQYYFLRWDIEVNHRDEKSLLGVGDAQVRAPLSVERNPQFAVISYSLLLLAGIRAYGPERTDDYLPLPKWRNETDRRPSTLDILSQFRREVMLAQLQIDLEAQLNSKSASEKLQKGGKTTGFVTTENEPRSPLILPIDIVSALLYADA
jgi:hypothetical protein